MRVRISYQPDGAISPCGPSTWGETEDYSLSIFSGAGINDNPLTQISIYPNPANEVLFVDLKDLENISSIAILDLNAKQIMALDDIQKGVNALQIDTLPAGSYFVRVLQDGYQYTQRVVKL